MGNGSNTCKGLWGMIQDGTIKARSWSEVTDKEKREWMRDLENAIQRPWGEREEVNLGMAVKM